MKQTEKCPNPNNAKFTCTRAPVVCELLGRPPSSCRCRSSLKAALVCVQLPTQTHVPDLEPGVRV